MTVALCNAALTMANRGHQNAQTDVSAQKNNLIDVVFWFVFLKLFLCLNQGFRFEPYLVACRKSHLCVIWALVWSSCRHVLSFPFNRPICLTSKCTHILLPSLRPPPLGAAVRGFAAAVSCYDVKTMTSPQMFFVPSPQPVIWLPTCCGPYEPPCHRVHAGVPPHLELQREGDGEHDIFPKTFPHRSTTHTIHAQQALTGGHLQRCMQRRTQNVSTFLLCVCGHTGITEEGRFSWVRYINQTITRQKKASHTW